MSGITINVFIDDKEVKSKCISFLPDNKIFVVLHRRLYQNLSGCYIIALLTCRTVGLSLY